MTTGVPSRDVQVAVLLYEQRAGRGGDRWVCTVSPRHFRSYCNAGDIYSASGRGSERPKRILFRVSTSVAARRDLCTFAGERASFSRVENDGTFESFTCISGGRSCIHRNAGSLGNNCILAATDSRPSLPPLSGHPENQYCSALNSARLPPLYLGRLSSVAAAPAGVLCTFPFRLCGFAQFKVFRCALSLFLSPVVAALRMKSVSWRFLPVIFPCRRLSVDGRRVVLTAVPSEEATLFQFIWPLPPSRTRERVFCEQSVARVFCLFVCFGGVCSCFFFF